MSNVSSSNSQKANVPKLRFPEFTDEWELVKLSDVASGFDYGIAAASTKYDGKNKYIRITDIDESSRKYKVIDPVSPDAILDDKYLVQENDILLARTGASVGKAYLYDKKDGNLYFAGFLIRINIFKDNANFIFAQTFTNNYWKWVNSTSMRSGQPGINSKEYATYSFYTTSKPEQDKIANFIALIDRRIYLQNEIIDKLKSYKRGVISHLNSHTSNSFEISIGSIFKITRGNVLSTREISPIKTSEYCYPVYSSQTKNEGLLGYYDEFLYENAITWTTDGANAGYTKYRQGKFYCTNVCGVLINDKGYSNAYVAEMINLISKKYVSYVGNPKLMNNVMSEIKLIVPKVQEQQKYSHILSFIDKRINMSTNILNNLNLIKDSLLQKMFI